MPDTNYSGLFLLNQVSMVSISACGIFAEPCGYGIGNAPER